MYQQSHEPDVLHIHQQNLWNPLSHEMDIIQPVALLKQERYKLGIGRLIYQLPASLCESFLHEVFLDEIPDKLDDETLLTINRFLQNNLNIAETSRQLHMHRNTLIYRLEQIEKRTGLDLRQFEDAMTFKIATMVMNYLHAEKGKNCTAV